MIYESSLSVDLSTWTFEVLIESALCPASVFSWKIPPQNILNTYAHGQKQLSLKVGCDMVDLPMELFQALLWEIHSCQQAIRSRNGQGRTG